MQKNKNYTDEVEKIKSLFKSAQSYKQSQVSNLNLSAVSATFTGGRKVYIHTNAPKAIIESINFFKNLGVNNLVLVSGQEVEPVIGFIKQSGVPVIVHSTHALPKRKDSSVDNGYTTAMKLNKAGVLVALAYTDSVMKARNLAFTAGTLVSYGMEKEQALQLITHNTAKILGIDKDYGTLEVGKSATLIITDGDALDMRGNNVESAFIDGRRLELTARQQRLNQRYLDKYELQKK
jgi:imidazolonepropionase-like amidohydrolase